MSLQTTTGAWCGVSSCVLVFDGQTERRVKTRTVIAWQHRECWILLICRSLWSLLRTVQYGPVPLPSYELIARACNRHETQLHVAIEMVVSWFLLRISGLLSNISSNLAWTLVMRACEAEMDEAARENQMCFPCNYKV